MAAPRPAPTIPDYGLDAPGWMFGMLLGGSVLLLVTPRVPLLVWPGLWTAFVGVVLVWSSRVGKHRLATRLLDGLALRGDETVLDVGCGHGLLLVGAAKRLPRGRAVGVDLWSQRDQADNRPEATRANAALEGVATRVEVRDGDMRKLPFADASFDTVVSSLAIHNVPGTAERDRAIREIARVLRPGGRVALLDIAHTRRYAHVLSAAGLDDVRLSRFLAAFFPPLRLVTGRKRA